MKAGDIRLGLLTAVIAALSATAGGQVANTAAAAPSAPITKMLLVGQPQSALQTPGPGTEVSRAMEREIAPSAEARCPRQATGLVDEEAPRLVCLALAFESTLPPEQQERLRLPFNAKHAVSWSNRPVGEFPRNGIALGELGTESLEAFKAMAREALRANGYDSMRGIILADDVVSAAAGGNPLWGSPLYYVAFLGDPSGEDPWMLQISGRHLAYNLAFNTQETGVTPMFLGVEPRRFEAGGREWAVMEPRLEAMYTMLRSLPPEQLAAAKLAEDYRDVVLGPGKDGHFPEAEGIPYSHLGEQQKQRVRSAVAAWVRTAEPAVAEQMLSDYFDPEALERTYISWSGSTDERVPGSYVRIDGPRLWLETVTLQEEAMPGRGHIHSVWRDRKADYGGSFF
ncbi:DUF3500 domain-containing protein [Paenibacillus herberti]|uniref:DUF3500 domain-containing protein n=1 Tax=Paenibacillus herberti TaxID=1619309 RepID=UPI001132785C|nr:DUF3500 domain-containing protein [Paenibacillus herberti]